MEIKKRIAVLILFFEKAHQTIECVNSFLPSGVNIYILNNGSSEHSTTLVNRFCSAYDQVTFFRSEKNLGVSAGRNVLINKTDQELLFFVDNDIVVKTENWLGIAARAIINNPGIEVFTPRVFNVQENCFSPYFSMDIIDDTMVFHFMDEAECGPETRLNCFPGGASIVRRTLFERLGMYDSDMFVGFEDYELAIRGIRTQPIAAVPLKAVTLFHNHVIARRNVFDRRAAAIRYKLSSHEDSLKKIQTKHGVRFSSNKAWKKWLSRQQSLLSPANPVAAKLSTFVKKVRSGLRR